MDFSRRTSTHSGHSPPDHDPNISEKLPQPEKAEYNKLTAAWRDFIVDWKISNIDRYVENFELEDCLKSRESDIEEGHRIALDLTKRNKERKDEVENNIHNEDSARIENWFATIAQALYDSAKDQIGDSREGRKKWLDTIRCEIKATNNEIPRCWPATLWEETKLTKEQRGLYEILIKEWAGFINFGVEKPMEDRMQKTAVGCKIISLDIIPENERGAIVELLERFRSPNSNVELVRLSIHEAFFKMFLGLFLVCKDNLEGYGLDECGLQDCNLEECRLEEHKHEEDISKIIKWRFNVLDTVGADNSLREHCPVSHCIDYIRGETEPLILHWAKTNPLPRINTGAKESSTDDEAEKSDPDPESEKSGPDLGSKESSTNPGPQESSTESEEL